MSGLRTRWSGGTVGFQSVLLLSALRLTLANPFPRDNIHDTGYGYIKARGCTNYCGSSNELCCSADTTCTTGLNSLASCVAPTSAAVATQSDDSVADVAAVATVHAAAELDDRQVNIYTTTWTETRIYTQTVSSTQQVFTSTTVVEKCVPPPGSGQVACGRICCASSQVCVYEGQCLDAQSSGGLPWSSGVGVIPITTIIGGVPITTTQYSAPWRPTSSQTATITAGVPPPAGTPIGGVAGSSGLSPGAIAGIVIGVLLGLLLLLLLLACCLCKDMFAACLGGKKKRAARYEREKIVEHEGHYVRHRRGSGSGHSNHTGRKVAAAAAGGGLAAWLGFGRKKREAELRRARSRSNYSSTYYSGSSSSGPSHSRVSRGTRSSRPTRSSRRSSRRP